jgi:hypothetical protein
MEDDQDDRPWKKFEQNVEEPADQSVLMGLYGQLEASWTRPASIIRPRRSRRWSATCASRWPAPA